MAAFADDRVQIALKSQEFRDALAKGDEFAGKFSSQALEIAYKNADLQAAFNHDGIEAALADPDMQLAMAQPEFARPLRFGRVPGAAR